MFDIERKSELESKLGQVEEGQKEGDEMDWLADDEMMRQWEAEGDNVYENEGRGTGVEGVQHVLELMVSQAQMRRSDSKQYRQNGSESIAHNEAKTCRKAKQKRKR